MNLTPAEVACLTGMALLAPATVACLVAGARAGHTEPEPVPAVQVAEARGWLADCGIPCPSAPAAVLATVEAHYDGGLAAFLLDSAPLLDVEVTA